MRPVVNSGNGRAFPKYEAGGSELGEWSGIPQIPFPESIPKILSIRGRKLSEKKYPIKNNIFVPRTIPRGPESIKSFPKKCLNKVRFGGWVRGMVGPENGPENGLGNGLRYRANM